MARQEFEFVAFSPPPPQRKGGGYRARGREKNTPTHTTNTDKKGGTGIEEGTCTKQKLVFLPGKEFAI